MAEYKDIHGTAVRNSAGNLAGAKTGELFYDSTNRDFKYQYPNVTTAGSWSTSNNINTTSAAFTLTLPASPDIGDEVSFVDYAGTFDTNNLTIGRNSSKIHGADEDLTVSVERAANTLVFTDSTQGWLLKSK